MCRRKRPWVRVLATATGRRRNELRRGPRGGLQARAQRYLRRGNPQVRVGQDPQEGAARPAQGGRFPIDGLSTIQDH